MKKWKIAGICLAVVVAAAASGCGKKTGTETTAAESTVQRQRSMSQRAA